MKKVLTVLMCTAMAAGLTACSGGQAAAPDTAADKSSDPSKVYTINCGISIASGTPRESSCDVCYAETFGEYVEEHSNGRIQFELFYGNSLGSDADVVAGISNGTVEFYCGDITTVSPYYKPALLFSIPNILQDKTYELEKYLVLDAHTGSYFCGIISESFFKSLPDDLKQVVLDGNEAAKAAVKETANSILTTGIEELKKNGVEIYEPAPEELAEWHSAYQSQCMDLAKEEIGADTVDDFVNAIKTYGSQS